MNYKHVRVIIAYLLFLFFEGMVCAVAGPAGKKVFEGVYGSKSKPDTVNYAETVGVDVGDYDNDGLRAAIEQLPTDGSKKLFYLKHRPIHRLIDVTVDGVSLNITGSPKTYSYHLENAWISFDCAYSPTTNVQATYQWSTDLDIVAANGDDQQAQPEMIYKNEGNFIFTEVVPVPTFVHQTKEAAFADFDNDGDLDIACANVDAPVRIYLNNGAGLFPNVLTLDPAKNADCLVWGDYNGDDYQDLLIGRYAGAKTSVYRYMPNPIDPNTKEFLKTWNNNAAQEVQGIDFADMDNDGDLDIVTATEGGYVIIWENIITNGPFIYLSLQYQTGNILKIDAGTGLVVNSYGSTVPSPGQLRNPMGVAVDADYIYVSDRDNNRIVKIKKDDLSYVEETNGIFPGNYLGFKKPQDIEVDDNYIYICDTDNHTIVKLLKNPFGFVASKGTYGVAGSGNDEFNTPTGLALDIVSGTGGTMYIGDSGNNRVVARDPSNLGFISNHTSINPFNGIYDVEVDTNYIYVVDSGNERLQQFFKNTFGFCNMVGSSGTGDNQFWLIKGICLDDNFVFINDRVNKRMHKRPISNITLLDSFLLKDEISDIRYMAYDNLGGSSPERTFVKKWQSDPNYPLPAEDLQCADTDNDGDLDILVACDNDSQTYSGPSYVMYRNDTIGGSGNFVFTKIVINSDQVTAEGVAAGDVDNDGDQDIVFAHQEFWTPSTVSYYKNNSGNTFNNEWNSFIDKPEYNDFQSQNCKLADLNNDGELDLVSSAEESSAFANEFCGIVVYQNNPNKKVIKVTSEAQKTRNKTKIILYYSVNADGTLGDIISTEVK